MIALARQSDSTQFDGHCPFEREIIRASTMIFGNGDDGIAARLARVEERVVQLQEDIRSLKDNDMRHMEVRLRWTIAIFMVLASLIGNILIKYIWR